jgi:hypothetical protein
LFSGISKERSGVTREGGAWVERKEVRGVAVVGFGITVNQPLHEVALATDLWGRKPLEGRFNLWQVGKGEVGFLSGEAGGLQEFANDLLVMGNAILATRTMFGGPPVGHD